MEVRLLSSLIILVIMSNSAFGVPTRKQNDTITSLPGMTFKFNYKQYSGYLHPTPRHFLHYWLVESQSKPSTDPLILWLNGGPGCSSLGGLFMENGPIHVNKDQKTLYENVFSWNKFANVLFLESPIGVGFSYSLDPINITNDDLTASDNYHALLDFLTVFPEYKTRDFYITGESYAGVYIPTLTKLVVEGINNGSFPNILRGFAIGNPILSRTQQHNSVINYMYYHGIIGDETWNEIKQECCGNTCGDTCDFYQSIKNIDKNNYTRCGNLTYYISDTLLWHTENDEYNIYQDCYIPNSKYLAFKYGLSELARFHSNNVQNINSNSTDALAGFPCWGYNSRNHYLNMMETRRAIHIPHSLDKLIWNSCTHKIHYQHQYHEMNPFFEYILQNSNISMLIYNGDVDMVCNFLGDEWFTSNITKSLNLNVTNSRKAWWYEKQIAGYVKQYDRIDLLTVKGSGHFVPTDRAGPALQMIANFVWKKPYSTETGISQKPQPLFGDGGNSAGATNFNSVLILLTAINIFTYFLR